MPVQPGAYGDRNSMAGCNAGVAGGGGGGGTLASMAVNCSHISAEAALRNATASFASAGALPLRDAWCATC